MSDYVCKTCRYLGRPERELRGSGAVELILLLCGVLPGIAYGVWRHRGPIHLCPRCRREVVPVESPAGTAFLASLPDRPATGLSRLERVSRGVRAIPLAGGAGLVGLMVLAIAAPSVRDMPWFTWLIYAAAAAILAHPVWLVISLPATTRSSLTAGSSEPNW